VLAHWPAAWACPEPPQPAPHSLLLSWVWLGSWVVLASFDASEEAVLYANWVSPALVAFCSASAEESASWLVSAHWPAAWAWPDPPQPAPQLLWLVWVWSVLWSVSAVLSAEELAPLTASCDPPTLSASCEASASEFASWSVVAHWPESWIWPEPPQPAPQLLLLSWDCSVLWSVLASFDADESA
jgi:hypothetical protein